MSIPDFEVVTAEIETFLTTDMTQVEEVLDYPPLELAGKSPVLSLHDDGVMPVDLSWKRWLVGYKATVSINMEAHGADGAETLLRQIRKALLTSLENHVQGTAYQALMVKGTSPDFGRDVVDGVFYRTEEVSFQVRVDCYS